MKILVFGLSGSGKTTLANKLNEYLNYTRINADEVRAEYNDWDFSNEGRLRQAKRLKELSDNHKNSITDFIAATENIRAIFNADITIWMDTVSSSKYKDTDNLFENPTSINYHVTTKKADKWAKLIYEDILYRGK
jgi:adenylylsulfate kinase